MASSMRGSCHCGAVVFEVETPLRDVVACHCSQCRKTSGHYWAASAVPLTQFRLIEDRGLAWFASSETARRGFCRDCGASLFWEPEVAAAPDEAPAMHFAPGALDGPTGLQIIAHIYKEDCGDYYQPSGPPVPNAAPLSAADLQGSCLCGANRFSLPGPMGEVHACHCTQCRKLSGHYSASFFVDPDIITWTARRIREYVTAAGGRRGYCPDCGSSLWFRAADGMLSLEAGAFDRPTGGQLISHIFMAEAGDYYRLDDALPQWQIWDEAPEQ